MATIIAKTKKFIDDTHAEIEKSIPTELIVQENKLYLGHDGEVLAGQEGQPLLQGPKGDKGDTGAQGPKGDIGPQGPKGDTGATPTITATASVNNAVGTPAVSVVKGGTAEAPTFAFNFKNLKGAKGDPGAGGGVELYRVFLKLENVVVANNTTFNLSSEFYLPVLTPFFIPQQKHTQADIVNAAHLQNILGNIMQSLFQSFQSFEVRYPASGMIVDTNGKLSLINGVRIGSGTLTITISELSGTVNSIDADIARTAITGVQASSFVQIDKVLGTTATLATITADDDTGDITITTPNNE